MNRIVILAIVATCTFCSAQQTQSTVTLVVAPPNGGGGPTPIVQGRDASLYGQLVGAQTTLGGVFKATTVGSLSSIYTFTNINTGWNPEGQVMLSSDGNYYGTTASGSGGSVNGVLYKLTPNGTYTVLHYFQGGTDGAGPTAPPIEGSDGNLYGTTSGLSGIAYSTIYKYARSGQFSTIYYLNSPGWVSTVYEKLLQGSDGSLFAVARTGGPVDDGQILKLSTSGQLLATYNFTGGSTSGAIPVGPLIQASDGNFYGTAQLGGPPGYGVIYKMTQKGVVTIFHSFSFANQGGYSPWGVVQGTDGYLYGGTFQGGVNFTGTLYRISLSGQYQHLYDYGTGFSSTGFNPIGPLLQSTSGLFYGVAAGGPSNTNDTGVIFSLNMGLGPFVAFVQPAGQVGSTVEILGQGFTGTTSVSFNGVPATSFAVSSDTYLTAVVPAGANTGPVVVTTPTQSLTSNVSFRIR